MFVSPLHRSFWQAWLLVVAAVLLTVFICKSSGSNIKLSYGAGFVLLIFVLGLGLVINIIIASHPKTNFQKKAEKIMYEAFNLAHLQRIESVSRKEDRTALLIRRNKTMGGDVWLTFTSDHQSYEFMSCCREGLWVRFSCVNEFPQSHENDLVWYLRVESISLGRVKNDSTPLVS